MSDYTIAVGPYLSGPVQELTFYDSWTLDKNLDDGCTFSFTVPGYSPEAAYISELDTDVWVYRSGLLDQRFRIIQVNQTWGPSGEDVIGVQAVCYRRLLGSRYVTSNLQFDQVSQGDIIWGLIDHTQSQLNGDLGITVGNLGPTVLRDRTYEVGQNILDVIVDMTNVIGGPTWDIDENLELVVSRADLYPFNPAPVVLGATANALSRPSSASKFGNVALVSGNGQETSTVIAEAIGLPTDPRGRWERRASYPNVVLQDTLQGHAEGLLTDFQAATTIWQVDVAQERYFSDAQYKLGDFVELVQPASTAAVVGSPAVRVFGQIMAIQVQQANSGEVSVSMRVLELGPSGVTLVGEDSDVVAGGYRTVTWTSTGSLILRGIDLDVEYLVVAGGGGGGGSTGLGGGGGGAGGLLTNVGGPLLNLVTGAYSVSVGAGGNGGPANSGGSGTNGGNSSFDTFVAVGGGLGRNPSTITADRNGSAGGSGGGGAGSSVTAGTGGAGTAGQGNNGGAGSVSATGSGGGGGGKGSAGGSPITAGAGVSNSITGSALTYAVGGTGGSTATAGAGANGTDGRGNGGGGAGGATAVGGNGGSGVVIVRWAV